jgi:hypothetical protein
MILDDDLLPEGAVMLEPRETYDKAVVGVTDDKVVYDQEKVIEAGVEIHGDYESSLEWHDFNTWSAYMGEQTPIYMRTLEE